MPRRLLPTSWIQAHYCTTWQFNIIQPFLLTLPSTKECICSECQTSVPSLESGYNWCFISRGVPWDKQQVSGFKKRLKSGTPSSSGSARMCMEVNELYIYRNATGSSRRYTDKKYAQDIKTYPEPAICLLMIVRWMILPDSVVIHSNFVSLPSTLPSV